MYLHDRVDRVLGFFSVVDLGPPHPQASVSFPFGSGGEGGQIRLRERGRRVPIRKRVQTLWYFRYIMYVLCALHPNGK